MNENETETAINSPLHELKGDEPVYDAFSLNTPAKSPNADHMPPTFSSQVIILISLFFLAKNLNAKFSYYLEGQGSSNFQS